VSQSNTTVALGQGGEAKSGDAHPTTLPPETPPPASRPSNLLFVFLDRVFLWLPGEHSPGLPAIAVTLARQAVLPIVLGIIPGLILLGSGANLSQFLAAKGHEDVFVYLAIGALIGCLAVVQELNRYAFVRRADRTVRSLLIITVTQIALGLLFNHDRAYTMSWQAAEQVAASVALYFGLRRRDYIGPIIILIMVGHVAVDLTAPGFFRPPEAISPPPVAAASVTAPAVGGMQAWAKLYPGSMVTSAKSSTLMGLTSWQVDYMTHASADQVRAFYQAAATNEGFTDTQTLAGMYVYRQTDTNNDFRVLAVQKATGTEVVFEARTFGGK
jgi:hypothetical protein